MNTVPHRNSSVPVDERKESHLKYSEIVSDREERRSKSPDLTSNPSEYGDSTITEESLNDVDSASAMEEIETTVSMKSISMMGLVEKRKRDDQENIWKTDACGFERDFGSYVGKMKNAASQESINTVVSVDKRYTDDSPNIWNTDDCGLRKSFAGSTGRINKAVSMDSIHTACSMDTRNTDDSENTWKNYDRKLRLNFGSSMGKMKNSSSMSRIDTVDCSSMDLRKNTASKESINKMGSVDKRYTDDSPNTWNTDDCGLRKSTASTTGRIKSAVSMDSINTTCPVDIRNTDDSENIWNTDDCELRRSSKDRL
jgi:hypothetical protein